MCECYLSFGASRWFRLWIDNLLLETLLFSLEKADCDFQIGDLHIPVRFHKPNIAPSLFCVKCIIIREGACAKLPETEVVLVEGHYIYMLHDLKALHLDPAAAKFAAVLYGHTHVPNFHTKKGVLYFNPGSCGPRRFELPVTVGILEIRPKETIPSIIPLDIRP